MQRVRLSLKAAFWEMDAVAWCKGIFKVLTRADGRGVRDRNRRREQLLEQKWKCENEARRMKEHSGLNGQRAKAGHVI